MTKNRNDGKLIPFEEIVKNREELVPKISEGYQQFEIILNNCIDNGIQTIACCAGHEISDYPYITFVYNRNSRKMINGFLNAIKDTKGTHIMFSTTGCTDNPFNVTVYANMINRDKVFNTIMHSLYEGKKSDTLYDDLNAVLRLAINLDYERNYFATVTLYNKMFMKSFILGLDSPRWKGNIFDKNKLFYYNNGFMSYYLYRNSKTLNIVSKSLEEIMKCCKVGDFKLDLDLSVEEKVDNIDKLNDELIKNTGSIKRY